MKTTRAFAFRTIGLVVASFLTIAVTAGSAEAAAASAPTANVIRPADTGWGAK